MPEIGSTLREARMRAGIDITEVELATKIRAKYLRALENEEWGLLPGPTFVKSFLRTYADYLGLDARLLIEEYKLRYERPSEVEAAPISASKPRDRERPRGPLVPRWAVIGVVVAGLLVALYALGKWGSTPSKTTSSAPPATASSGRRAPARGHGHARPATPAPGAQVELRIRPTGTVYVCLVDERGRKLVPGRTLSAGQSLPPFTGRLLRVTLGNNLVDLKVNGKPLPVAPSAGAIGLELTPTGHKPLAPGHLPSCA